jgi:hypothetical protein
VRADLPPYEISSSSIGAKKAAAARSTGLRPIHFSNRAETAARFSASGDNHYRIVIFGKRNFVGRPPMENGIMKSSSERVEKSSARGRSERQIPKTARQNQKIIAKPANGRHYWTVQLRVAAFVDKRRYNARGAKVKRMRRLCRSRDLFRELSSRFQVRARDYRLVLQAELSSSSRW